MARIRSNEVQSSEPEVAILWKCKSETFDFCLLTMGGQSEAFTPIKLLIGIQFQELVLSRGRLLPRHFYHSVILGAIGCDLL